MSFVRTRCAYLAASVLWIAQRLRAHGSELRTARPSRNCEAISCRARSALANRVRTRMNSSRGRREDVLRCEFSHTKCVYLGARAVRTELLCAVRGRVRRVASVKREFFVRHAVCACRVVRTFVAKRSRAHRSSGLAVQVRELREVARRSYLATGQLRCAKLWPSERT